MLRLTVHFADRSGNNHLVELRGLTKRLNAIGFQPVPGDQFNVEDLSKEDKECIGLEKINGKPLIVSAREFCFGDAYSALHVKLTMGE